MLAANPSGGQAGRENLRRPGLGAAVSTAYAAHEFRFTPR
jgi:hypothetical protein